MMASEEISPCQEAVECDLCQKPVSFFCRRCGVNLCDTCIPVHLRVKSKTGHDVVDYMSKDNDDTCFCDSHPKHECSAYCKTCDSPICVVCISTEHKSHKMSKLSDKIEELLNDIAQENDYLKSFRRNIEVFLDDTTNQLSSLSSVYQKTKEEVTTNGEEWHKLIDDHVKKLHQELDDLKKENEAVLQKQVREFEKMIGKMNKINRKFTQLQKSQNIPKIEKFARVIHEQKFNKENIQYTSPTFQKCKINNKNMQKYFGSIRKMQERQIFLLEKKSSRGFSSDKKILETPSVSSIIDTGFPTSKKENRLYNMAITDDKKVWMGGASNELKLFDIKGNLHRTVTIPCRGRHICMLNNQVVLSDYNDKAVKKVSDDGTVVTMFGTGNSVPRCITGTASGDLLVGLCTDDQSKIVRYSSSGSVLQEIQYDLHGQPLYQAALYITENVNSDVIVTDVNKKAVITVDRLGTFRYSYTGMKHSLNPYGVVADSVGHVIVADISGSKIHMLNQDGKFLTYIIPKGGIQDPRALVMISEDELIIGESMTGLAKTIKFLE